jgi:hypothetical protein
LSERHFDWWTKDDDLRGDGYKLVLWRPLDEPLKIYPVSDLVNITKTDDPRGSEL